MAVVEEGVRIVPERGERCIADVTFDVGVGKGEATFDTAVALNADGVNPCLAAGPSGTDHGIGDKGGIITDAVGACDGEAFPTVGALKVGDE